MSSATVVKPAAGAPPAPSGRVAAGWHGGRAVWRTRARYFGPPLVAWALVMVLCAMALDWARDTQHSGWERLQRDRVAVAGHYTSLYMADVINRERTMAER